MIDVKFSWSLNAGVPVPSKLPQAVAVLLAVAFPVVLVSFAWKSHVDAESS